MKRDVSILAAHCTWNVRATYQTDIRKEGLSLNEEKEVQENRKNHNSLGEVKIASDVVATIAALAANEVDGVYSMSGNLTNEIIGKFSGKNMSKGVRVMMDANSVHVDMNVNVRYGYQIPEVVKQVQERVSQQIETMTGLHVLEVNIRISGVRLSENE